MIRVKIFVVVLFCAAAAFAQQTAPSGGRAAIAHEFILARLAAEEGRFDEALTRINRVVEASPGDAVILFERASLLVDARQLDRAEKELRAIVRRWPAFYDAQRLLGRLLIDQSGGQRAKVEEAVRHLHAAFKLSPGDLGTGLALTQILVSLGRVADAEPILATLAEVAPDNRSVNLQYAQVLTKLGRGDEARKYLERVIAADPLHVPTVLQLFDIYEQTNEWEKAAAALEPLIADDPLNRDLQRQHAYALLRAGEAEKARASFEQLVRSDANDRRSHFFLAESLNELSRFAEAEVIYRRLLGEQPDNPEFLISFALNQIGQRKFAEAASTFERIIANDTVPERVRVMARAELAAIAREQGDYETAMREARAAIEASKPPALKPVGIVLDIYRRQKKYPEALQLIEPLARQYPDEPFFTARLVEFLVRSGRTAEARTIANTQAAAGKRPALQVAQALAQTEQYSDAVAILQKLQKADPEDEDLQFQIGSVYERMGDVARAEQAFLALLERRPEHAPALNYLGYMWADRGVNLQRAAVMIEKAVAIEPRNAAYIDSLGWVYFKLGKLDSAEKHLVDAANLLPTDPTVQEHLGDLYARQGSVQAALERYRAALGLDPDEKDEAKIRQKIATIEKRSNAQ